MKVLIGVDVDPVLPQDLRRPPDGDIWSTLDGIPALIEACAGDLPPMTWLIRADESIRFATGDYASGYVSRRPVWDRLRGLGHELGWHMHVLSRPPEQRDFVFDARPDWLGRAHEALSRHFPVQATRTGWDYGSPFLFQTLDRLGVRLDFSAMPGNISWFNAGQSRIEVDWLRCAADPYRPSREDHQRPGADSLRLLEVPLTQFPNTPLGMLKRLARRSVHGCYSLTGLGRRVNRLTEKWKGLPRRRAEVWAFYFHPEELTAQGVENSRDNLARLGAAGAEFVTAGAVDAWYEGRTGATQA